MRRSTSFAQALEFLAFAVESVSLLIAVISPAATPSASTGFSAAWRLRFSRNSFMALSCGRYSLIIGGDFSARLIPSRKDDGLQGDQIEIRQLDGAIFENGDHVQHGFALRRPLLHGLIVLFYQLVVLVDQFVVIIVESSRFDERSEKSSGEHTQSEPIL